MVQTVLANPGSIGISFAGVTDEFKIAANVLMMAERLFGAVIDEVDIAQSLEADDIAPTQENIDKVKAFFPGNRVWR